MRAGLGLYTSDVTECLKGRPIRRKSPIAHLWRPSFATHAPIVRAALLGLHCVQVMQMLTKSSNHIKKPCSLPVVPVTDTRAR